MYRNLTANLVLLKPLHFPNTKPFAIVVSVLNSEIYTQIYKYIALVHVIKSGSTPKSTIMLHNGDWRTDA